MLYHMEPTEHFQYYMRITYHATREVHDTRFNSMKEIVEYVYYNIPNSDAYTYTLVCRNRLVNKEYSILLRHNKANPSKKLAL